MLKVSNDKNAQQLEQEQLILLKLQSLGMGDLTLIPHKTIEGKVLYHYKKLFGVLYPFVEGQIPTPNEGSCQEIGRALAKLHTCGQGQKLEGIRSHEEVGNGPLQIFIYTQGPRCPEDYAQSFAQLFPDQAQGFIQSPFVKGLIHGDLYYDNTLFKGDKIDRLLDFEQSGQGEFLLDLGISISGSCLQQEKLSAPLIDAYLQGYQEVRALPSLEKSYFHQAVMLGLFSIALWRIKRFKEGTLNPAMAPSYKALLKRAHDYHQLLQSGFDPLK